MQFSPVEKYSPKLKTTQILHYNRISAKIEALKAIAAFGASFFMPIYKNDSIFIEMTPPVNISDVIKACFDIINAGRNQTLNENDIKIRKMTPVRCQFPVKKTSIG